MHCLYFICERKFYACTYVKITRHWKSTLSSFSVMIDWNTWKYSGYFSLHCLFISPSRFCVNQCSVPGYCAPQAFRQEVLPLPLEFPANTNIARLIPFFPPYMASLQYYCQFQYTFEVQPSPFGIRLLANEAMIYTKQKLEKAGIHKLRVTADLFYMDGTLACRTVFTVYIDVAKFSF